MRAKRKQTTSLHGMKGYDPVGGQYFSRPMNAFSKKQSYAPRAPENGEIFTCFEESRSVYLVLFVWRAASFIRRNTTETASARRQGLRCWQYDSKCVYHPCGLSPVPPAVIFLIAGRGWAG